MRKSVSEAAHGARIRMTTHSLWEQGHLQRIPCARETGRTLETRRIIAGVENNGFYTSQLADYLLFS